MRRIEEYTKFKAIKDNNKKYSLALWEVMQVQPCRIDTSAFIIQEAR